MSIETNIKLGSYVKFFVNYEKRFRGKKIKKVEIAFGFVKNKRENYYVIDIEKPENIKRRYGSLTIHKKEILEVFPDLRKNLL